MTQARRSFVIAFSGAVLWVVQAAAQAYPSRPITIIVPSAAGGLSDAFVRLIGDTIQGAWGQPVVMDPRSGAGGIIGTQVVANAAPDGYTLLMGNIGPLAINPTLYSSLPYDVETQLAPVALVATYPNVLVVNPSLPIHSIADLIRYAKEKPGTLNFASAGIGQSQHLSGEMFKSMADIDIVHVPYKGTGPALTDLLSGSVQMMFSNVPAAVPYIESGKLRAIAVTGLTRSKALPQVPTVNEAGLPGYDVVSWLALMAPAKTPEEIIARLNAEVAKALASPAGQRHLAAVGADAGSGSGSPQAVARFLKEEQAKWSKVIKEANVKPL
jgi:tripartite-type tricarboxylate transporter receptor subunit TctC